ncbi:glycosyltransferase [Rhodococcus sp. SBT000017]|uniref:glycosyltransferase n=1 Tax=Rhodococcus sp. SBT000017 TaxID=1803385 RepID=UPI000EF8915D|nr:glycosyltransferase [Rhodococcus sp. SBT000017]RMB77370.1 glycosyltransferase [Rhodococcus sp. SBT000017]
MRILHVVTLVSPDGAFGGPVTVAFNQAAELARRGHDVTVCGGTRGYEAIPTERDGVALQLFPVVQLPRLGFAGMTSPGLVRWVRANVTDFDVVHVHLARDLVTMPMALMAVLRAEKVVVQTHGMVVSDTRLSTKVFDRLLTRPVFARVAAALYLNDRELKSLRNIGGHGLSCVELINGVKPYETRDPAAETSGEVVFVGRLHRRKNAPMFVAAAHLLIERGSAAHFTLVGPDEGDGAAVSAAIDGEQQISWIGALGPNDVVDLLRKAAIYVLPAVDEPFPMTVLEAMSVGLPVVITTSCGLADFVTEHGAGLVVDATAADIAGAIDELLANPDRAQAMAARGRQAVRSHASVDAVVTKLVAYYQ